MVSTSLTLVSVGCIRSSITAKPAPAAKPMSAKSMDMLETELDCAAAAATGSLISSRCPSISTCGSSSLLIVISDCHMASPSSAVGQASRTFKICVDPSCEIERLERTSLIVTPSSARSLMSASITRSLRIT